MSEKFDEIEERIMNERAWGLGVVFALIAVAAVIAAVGHAFGYW
jgi:hypothetical protein